MIYFWNFLCNIFRSQLTMGTETRETKAQKVVMGGALLFSDHATGEDKVKFVSSRRRDFYFFLSNYPELSFSGLPL